MSNNNTNNDYNNYNNNEINITINKDYNIEASRSIITSTMIMKILRRRHV